ncbi:MAG: serine/threonine-protein kinase [Polyangia bacterium]
MSDEILCPKCNAANPRGTAYCGKCGASMEAVAGNGGEEADPLLGQMVGDRFKVKRKIGEGGMGIVYEADQIAIDRIVALKVLHPNLSDGTVYARFRNEAAASSRLGHPNTITVFDFGKTEQGSLYIAMEFVSGKSLDDEIEDNGALDWRRTCRIGMQICGSLQEAHDNGIIHRDLKPENVMLCERGGEVDVAKVLDFGIAKILEDEGQDQRKALTKTGMVFGTPQYMSPEQIRGEKVDARSDIYSMGVILYQMLAGRLPFTSETPMGMLTKHLMDTPPKFEEMDSSLEVPEELERLVMEALAKDAADRPATMRELGERMESVLATAGGTAVAAGATQAGAAVSGGSPPTRASSARTAGTPGSGLPETVVPDEPIAPGTAAGAGSGKGKGLIVGISIGALVLLLAGGAAAWYFVWGPGAGGDREVGQQQLAQDAGQGTAQQLAQVGQSPPPVGPQAGGGPAAGDQQASGGSADAGQALPPLPAVPEDDEEEKDEEKDEKKKKSGGKGGSKKTNAPCRVSASKDLVAGAVLANLKRMEGAIKRCAKTNGDHRTVFSFRVPSGGDHLERIKVVESAGMDTCLQRILDSKLAVTDKGSRSGKASFDIEKSSGTIDSCKIQVSASKSLAKVKPVFPGKKKPEKKKPEKKKGKSGLKIIKKP